jgi:hypothetical protein
LRTTTNPSIDRRIKSMGGKLKRIDKTFWHSHSSMDALYWSQDLAQRRDNKSLSFALLIWSFLFLFRITLCPHCSFKMNDLVSLVDAFPVEIFEEIRTL